MGGDAEGLWLRGKTYWADFYWEGERVRKSLRTRDPDEALERLGLLAAGLRERAETHRPSPVTAEAAVAEETQQAAPQTAAAQVGAFEGVGEAYLTDLKRRTEKGNSIRCAAYQLDQLLRAVPELRTRRLRREDVRSFVDARMGDGVSPATVNQGLSIIQAALRYGLRERLIRDPGIDFGVFKLKKVKRDRYLSRAEVERLIETAKFVDARAYALIFLAYHTGARLGELLHLRWGWMDLETGRVVIRSTAAWSSKTREGRTFYVPPAVTDWLRDYRNGLDHSGSDDPVLQMRPGRAWTEHVHKVLRRVFRAAGIDSRIGVHGLRHSSVTDMLESGVPVHVVQVHHGHQSSETTLRYYAHAQDGALREAAERMAERRTG